MRSLYQRLYDLQQLKAIASESGIEETSQLERDFLSFPSIIAEKKLIVKIPKLYKVEGEEIQHLSDALSYLNMPHQKVPSFVDLSGNFNYHSSAQDSIILFSPSQYEMDHISQEKAYLHPLLKKIFIDGAGLIQNYALHEALCGKVNIKRGDLNLLEFSLFPEKFKPGPFELSVTLDTPSNTITSYESLCRTLEKAKEDPKLFMLDPKKVKETVEKALELRAKLGALSRYDIPKATKFSALTTSCIIRNNNYSAYHLSLPNQENVIVSFGQPVLNTAQSIPSGLTLLSGDDATDTLKKLVELGVYITPSLPMLQKRLLDLETIYHQATRLKKSALSADCPDFFSLINHIKDSCRYFESAANEQSRRQYLLHGPKHYLEFIACPSTNNPVIHALLPRLSAIKSLQLYHDTPNFIENFNKSSEEQQKSLIDIITSYAILGNQQNIDVNLWLYENHRKSVENQGIEFIVE